MFLARLRTMVPLQQVELSLLVLGTVVLVARLISQPQLLRGLELHRPAGLTAVSALLIDLVAVAVFPLSKQAELHFLKPSKPSGVRHVILAPPAPSISNHQPTALTWASSR